MGSFAWRATPKMAATSSRAPAAAPRLAAGVEGQQLNALPHPLQLRNKHFERLEPVPLEGTTGEGRRLPQQGQAALLAAEELGQVLGLEVERGAHLEPGGGLFLP